MALVPRLPALLVATLIALAAPGPLGCRPADIEIGETDVEVVDVRVGRGRPVVAGDVVCIDYRIVRPDGEEVMRAKDFCFTLGAEAVIRGIDDAVVGMQVGGRRRVNCPPHKHWGRSGYANGRIPPNTNLVLHITLKGIEDRSTG